jgi:hypothetical protein
MFFEKSMNLSRGGRGVNLYFTFTIDSAANPPGLQYQGPSASNISGSKTEGLVGVGGGSGGVCLTDQDLLYRILLACQQALPIT